MSFKVANPVITVDDILKASEHAGDPDYLQWPESWRQVSLPDLMFGTTGEHQEYLDWFKANVCQALYQRYPRLTHIAMFQNLELRPDRTPPTQFLAIGPENTYKTLEEVNGEHLGDVPSRFMYFRWALTVEDLKASGWIQA